jgi:hypothetical protein
VLLFAAQALMIGFLAARASGGSVPAFLCGCLLVFTSPTLLNVNSMVWSEPLFLVVSLGGALLLARHRAQPRRAILACGAALLGLSLLARYAGIGFAAAGGWYVLLAGRRGWKDRIADAAIYGLGCGLPLAAWLVRNAYVAESAVGRTVALHPAGMTHARHALAVVSGWFFVPARPAGLREVWIGLAVILVLSLAYGRLWLDLRRARPPAPVRSEFPALVPLFTVLYVLLLTVIITFVDPLVLQDRTLAPVYFFSLAGFVAMAFRRRSGSLPGAKSAPSRRTRTGSRGNAGRNSERNGTRWDGWRRPAARSSSTSSGWPPGICPAPGS